MAGATCTVTMQVIDLVAAMETMALDTPPLGAN
jgi:hypothetical protein